LFVLLFSWLYIFVPAEGGTRNRSSPSSKSIQRSQEVVPPLRCHNNPFVAPSTSHHLPSKNFTTGEVGASSLNSISSSEGST